MTDETNHLAHRIETLEGELRRVRDEIPTVEDLSNHRNLVEFRKWTREQLTKVNDKIDNLQVQISAIRALQGKRAARIAALEEAVKTATNLASSANLWIKVTAASIGGATVFAGFMVGLWYLISLTVLPLLLPK